MYSQSFGLNKLPFRLRPDPDFLYPGQEYLRARGHLLGALRGSSRMILFLGPPGVGKTLLLEDMLREISGQFAVCRINQPHVSPTELLQAVLLQLGSAGESADAKGPTLFTQLSAALHAAAARHAVPLLVIDDAHLLATATLNTFGDLLTRTPRLKILLIGRHDPLNVRAGLVTRLNDVEGSRQVHLPAFSIVESKAYIEHRLSLAGGGQALFTADACAMIYQQTGGVARLINVLCDAALHAACMRASGQVNAAEILQATQDSRWPHALAREQPGALPDRGAESMPVADAREGSGRPPPVSAQLVVMHRNERLATLPMEPGCISIGRAIDNELHLDACYISRHHCQVMTVGNISTIEDLGSVNGIFVNGQEVKSHTLRHADEIALGEHVLMYVVN